MADHVDITLWIDRRWKDAIEKHLKDETLQARCAAPGTTVDQCVYSAYLPGINPYTGQIMYLHYRDLIPVRG